MKKSTTIIVLTGLTVILSSCNKNAEKKQENNNDTVKIEATTAQNSDDFDINQIAVSTVDLGDFPYLKLPNDYLYNDPDHIQNGSGKGQIVDMDKEYFLNKGVYLPIEGKTFKAHINLDRNTKDKTFSSLELQKNFDEVLSKMGAVKINNGAGYNKGEKDRINSLDAQAESNGYVSSSQYYDNIHTYIIRKPDYNVWVQYNLGGETGYITVLKTEKVEIK